MRILAIRIRHSEPAGRRMISTTKNSSPSGKMLVLVLLMLRMSGVGWLDWRVTDLITAPQKRTDKN